MAGCDYYSCDGCGCKTFYDSELSYDDGNENSETHHPLPNGNVGYMKVLCKECASKSLDEARSTNTGMDAIAVLYETARLIDSIGSITKGSHIHKRIMAIVAQQHHT